jgi:drug/metabolite transporter (DMT)-like permease
LLPADSSAHRRATLHALGAIGLWGTLAALSLELGHVPPLLLIAISLLLGAACGARGIRLRGMRPALLALGVYGMFAYHLCLFLGLRLAPAVEANLLNYLWPLLIVVLTPLFIRGARLRPRHVAGALLGFAGAALLVTGGELGFSAAGARGYAFAIAAAVIWSTYSLMIRRLGGQGTSTVATFCLVAGALSLAAHAALEPRYVPRAADLPYLLLIGVGPMGAAFYLWDRALRAGDPRVIGTLAYLTPLLSTLFIVAFGAGRLTAVSAAAMAMIIGGAVIGSRPDRQPSADG